MKLSGKHLINDDWVASGGERFAATNPASGEELAPAFAQAGDAGVKAAMESAHHAFLISAELPRMLRPRGPVVVFGASNFPFAFGALGGDTASALAAGCPVVVKGHPSHPGVNELMASAVVAALRDPKINLPPGGWFAMLQGRSHALSNALVTPPHTAAVRFTGSLPAGRGPG